MEARARSEAAPLPRGSGIPPALFAQHNGVRYRTPIDLQAGPDGKLRFLLLGDCLAQPFAEVAALMNKNFTGDFKLVNNFDQAPEIPAAQAAQHDFQIIHIPLRTVLGQAYFRLSDDGSEHERFLFRGEEP
jgi:hypothetical protein